MREASAGTLARSLIDSTGYCLFLHRRPRVLLTPDLSVARALVWLQSPTRLLGSGTCSEWQAQVVVFQE